MTHSNSENLLQVLVDWINSTLKREHIVVQHLEEDIFDGLVIHHLLGETHTSTNICAYTHKHTHISICFSLWLFDLVCVCAVRSQSSRGAAARG